MWNVWRRIITPCLQSGQRMLMREKNTFSLTYLTWAILRFAPWSHRNRQCCSSKAFSHLPKAFIINMPYVSHRLYPNKRYFLYGLKLDFFCRALYLPVRNGLHALSPSWTACYPCYRCAHPAWNRTLRVVAVNVISTQYVLNGFFIQLKGILSDYTSVTQAIC